MEEVCGAWVRETGPHQGLLRVLRKALVTPGSKLAAESSYYIRGWPGGGKKECDSGTSHDGFSKAYCRSFLAGNFWWPNCYRKGQAPPQGRLSGWLGHDGGLGLSGDKLSEREVKRRKREAQSV